MDDLQQQYEYLARVDQYLTAGERLLAYLVAQIDEMTERGEDTAALKRLRLFQEALEQCQAHRQMILVAIARHTVP
jgi:hypothetical protein